MKTFWKALWSFIKPAVQGISNPEQAEVQAKERDAELRKAEGRDPP